MLLNHQREVRIARQPLKPFLTDLRRALGIARADWNLCLVSDRAMRALNRKFRKKDRSTDVLSFSAAPREKPLRIGSRARKSRRAPRTEFLGDVAISPLTARRNARRLGKSFQDELRILILHGVLHLMGYDHETDRGEMHRLESRLRRRLGL